MADIDIPQTRETIDILAPLGVAQHRALAVDDDQRLPVIVRVMQRVQQKPPVGFEQLGGAVHLCLLWIVPPYPGPTASTSLLPRTLNGRTIARIARKTSDGYPRLVKRGE